MLVFHRRRHLQPRTHRYFAEMKRLVRICAYLFTGIFVSNDTVNRARDGKDEPRIESPRMLDENVRGMKVPRRAVQIAPSSRVIRTPLLPLAPGVI